MDYNLKDEEILNLMAKMNTNNDNKITYEEFVNFYHIIPINNI